MFGKLKEFKYNNKLSMYCPNNKICRTLSDRSNLGSKITDCNVEVMFHK